MQPDLGTAGSWVRDGALAGTLMPMGALLALGLPAWWRGLLSPTFLDVLVTAVVLGGLLGAVAGAPALFAARLLWRAGPLPAFALGPVLGALCAPLLVGATELAMEGTPSWRAMAAVAGFGALSLGLPWLAYLAVRSRGRSGVSVALLALLWAAMCSALIMVASLYELYG